MAAGDHLRVNRGGEVDHAIDVGDRTVIRWRAGVGVERVEQALFAPAGAAVEVVLHRERVFRPALVVARAFSRFAEAAYRAMFQGPEQFAVWCKSDQLPPVAAPAPKPVRRASGAARPARKPSRAARPARKAAARKAAPKKGARKAAKRATRVVRRPARKVAAKAPPRKAAPRLAKGRRVARKGKRR